MEFLSYTKTTLPDNGSEESDVDERHEESRPTSSHACWGTGGQDDLQAESEVVHHEVNEGRRFQISSVDLNLFLALAGVKPREILTRDNCNFEKYFHKNLNLFHPARLIELQIL